MEKQNRDRKKLNQKKKQSCEKYRKNPIESWQDNPIVIRKPNDDNKKVKYNNNEI